MGDLKEPVRSSGESQQIAQNVRFAVRLQSHGEYGQIMLHSLHLACLGVLKDEEELALHLFDAGDARAHKVDAQLLGPHVEFFVSFPTGPDVDVVDGDISMRILLLDQLRVFKRGHAADARAVEVSDRRVTRADALQERYLLGNLAFAGLHHLPLGRPGGVEHPLHLQRCDNVPVPAKAVLLFSGGIKGLPAGSHDDGAHIQLEILGLLVQFNRLGRTGFHAAGAAYAGLGIDAGHQGHGLGVGDINGLSLADGKVVLAGHLHRAHIGTLTDAALAQLLVHIACFANAGHGEVAHAALHAQDLGVGDESNIWMIVDLGHLGTQHANRAVVGGKDVGEQSHVAADGGPPLH